MFILTGTAVPYFLYAFGIILREGLEAILVIIALAAGTRGVEGQDRSRDVYYGAMLAVIASVALAWAVNHLIGDDASDTLEGVFQFLAAATLFYVSSWLTSKAQSDQWHQFIRSKVESARASAAPSIALGLTAFLAVIREGGETIVFFQALTAGATLAAVFSVTSVMLYALAVVFIGQGVASWQESGMLGATFIDHVPQITALGIFPTVQSIGAQLILIVVAILSYLLPRGRSQNGVKQTALKVEARAPSASR